MPTGVIDSLEGQDFATCNIPNAFYKLNCVNVTEMVIEPS